MWADPEYTARQQDFMQVMVLCLEKLPPNSARVFMLRELFEVDVEEICADFYFPQSSGRTVVHGEPASLALRRILIRH